MRRRGDLFTFMTTSAKSDWLIPASLIVLSLVPVAAGISRIAGLAGGGPVAAADARFFASPAPVVIHIIAAAIFCVVGALQFSPGFRRRHRRWHRLAGWILIPCGLAAALAGLWMAAFYPNASNGSDVLKAERLVVGTAMTVFLILAFVAVRRRDVTRHGAWMIRAYAIGQGAGTQVLTGLPWLLLVGVPGVAASAVLLGAGWVINIIVAEWIIRRWLPQGNARRGAKSEPAPVESETF